VHVRSTQGAGQCPCGIEQSLPPIAANRDLEDVSIILRPCVARVKEGGGEQALHL
jgi:hypothetical protein